jgi:hypothetical protein
MNRRTIIGLNVSLICLVLGCSKSSEPEPITIALEGDPAATARVEAIVEENPELLIPGTRTKYSMIVVSPDAGVDYKILQVTPDPNVDYKIIVIDPTSGDELPDLSRTFCDALREKLRQDQKESRE